MKLFKKALLATAIFGAMGVQAADVTNAVTKTSKQGIEVSGVTASTSVRVIVREQLEAGDQITLVFGKGIKDITAVATDGTDPTKAGATSIDGQLGIVYGSGTYALKEVSTTTSTSGVITVVLEVKTGDPVTKDSSFEVQVRGNNINVDKVTDATVTYSAVSALTGNAIDTEGTNKGSFVVLADQYTASVDEAFDAVLNRTNAAAIIDNGEDELDADSATLDSLKIKLTDNQALVSAIAANDKNGDATTGDFVALEFSIVGDFTDYDASEVDAFFEGDTATSVISGAAVNASETELSFTVTPVVASTSLGDVTVVLGGAATSTPAGKFNPSDFEVSVDVAFGGSKELAVLNDADAGEIRLDATLINIPYFPVGFDSLSTSVHFSNESNKDADVIVTAFDEAGNEYESDELPALVKGSVTKYTQSMIMDKLEVPAGTKLSITFNIDADDGDVNAYAFSNAGTARQALVTSQEKGIK